MLNWQMCVASAAKSGKKCNWRKKNFAPKETNEGKPKHNVTKKNSKESTEENEQLVAEGCEGEEVGKGKGGKRKAARGWQRKQRSGSPETV